MNFWWIPDDLLIVSDDFLNDFTGFSQVSNDGCQSVGLKGAIGAAIHKTSQANVPWEGTISNKEGAYQLEVMRM